MNNILKLILLTLFLAVYGCKQGGSGTENNRELIPENDELGFGNDNITEIYHRFPSPEEMMSVLQHDNLLYNEDILNSTENSREYLSSKSQALNIGVYSADLAYLTLFNKHQESTSYFEAIYNLSSELRISSAFDIELLRRVQSNMTNPDSLKVLTDFAFTKISNYLVSNNKEKTFAVISIGGFVEALYLSFNYSGEFSEENIVVQRIADQKLVLENIVAYSRQFNDVVVNESLETLNPIRTVYNELISEQQETTVTKDKDGKLVISGGNKIVITKAQYEQLRNAAMQVRKEITQN